jgi:alkylated DNA repair dioxygenase AlkB
MALLVRGALQGAELLRFVEGALPPGLALVRSVLDADAGARLLAELQTVPLRATTQYHLQQQGQQQQGQHQQQGHQQQGQHQHQQQGSEQQPSVVREMANIYGRQLAEMREVQRFFDEAVLGRGVLERDHRPNASQLNAYPAHGGIPFHVDARGIGAVIGMVSFQSPCVMELVPAAAAVTAAQAGGGAAVTRVLLEPLSLLVLAGPARYEWAHRVAPTNPHVFQGREVHRGPRTSFVFWSTRVDPNAPQFERPADVRERIALVSGPAPRRKPVVVPR